MFLSLVNCAPFRIHKIWMKLIGVWPLDRHQRRSTIVFVITLLAQIAIVTTCLTHPLKKCLPKEFQSNHYTRISVTMLGIVQQINYRVSGPRMVPLIRATIDDSFLITNVKERNIIPGHVTCRAFIAEALCTHFVFVNCIWHLASLLFTYKAVLTNRQETCAFAIGSTWVALVIPALSLTTFVLFKLSSFGSLMLLWSFVIHISGQYRIMKEQLQHFLLMKESKHSRKKFGQLVERHNRLLNLGGILDNSCSAFIVVHVLFIQFYIGLFAFQQITGNKGSHPILTIYNFSNGMLSVVTLYLYYYAGECLTSCSEEIRDVFAQCNWYELSKKSIVNYSIVIARCQTPAKLTAGKIYEMNLLNFKYVVNALYSYISCIMVVVNKDKG